MVSLCREIFLLCFATAVLTFFIAGLLYRLCFEHVNNLGAYSIPPETGLLIPSVLNSYDPICGGLVSNLMIQRLIAAVAVSVLIACCSMFLYSQLLRKRAQFIVRTTYELSEEKRSHTVGEIRERFGSGLQLDECRGSECGYKIVLSNRVLAALHLVPFTEMESYFWTRDAVVYRNMLDYTTTVNRRYRIVSHVQIDFCKGCQAVDIHPWDAASPLDTNGLVGIGSEATAQSRRTILSINTGCLTRLGGCQTVADLLPAAWKRTADGKIACVIQNDRGFVEKPADWP
jgi:hypothetical protein